MNEHMWTETSMRPIRPSQALSPPITIVEEITKNWNHVQGELKYLNEEMVGVRQSQMAVQGLVEGIVQ